MEKESQGNSLKKVWEYIGAFIGLVGGLASLILQFVAWSRDAATMRYVSFAPFIAALATAIWFAYRAWKQRKGKHLAAILTALFLVSCGYAFLWGIWVEPPTPGCADYALQITSPLDGSTVRTDTIEVRGTLQGNPPEGSLVVFVRSADGVLNWPQFTPVEIDPVLGIWKGPANVLAGNEPLTYRIAVAFVGKSGRALLALYRKMGQDCSCWPGIEFLPDDIQICDEVSITRAP